MEENILKINEHEKQQQIHLEAPQQVLNRQVDLSRLSKAEKTYNLREKDSVLEQQNKSFLEKRKNKNYMGTKDQMLESAKLLRNSSVLLIRDKKWYRLFNWESDEMTKVKQTTAYLNNLLDKEVKLSGGKLDLVYLEETILPAYQAAFEACDFYISEKRRKGQAKRTVGIRRLKAVENMMGLLREEWDNYKLVKDNGFVGIDLQGKKSMRELLGEIRKKKARISRFMPEGNSSNVYRVKVEGEKDGKAYFVKKDEKLIHENMGLYLTLRIAELKRSKEVRRKYDQMNEEDYKAAVNAREEEIKKIDEQVKRGELSEEAGDKRIIEIRAEREELRLEGKISMTDYQNALTFLEKLDADVNKAADADKKSAYIALLAHDYDKFFTQRQIYNANVRQLKASGSTIDELISTLKREKKGNWEAQVRELEKRKAGAMEEMSEWQWFEAHIEELGLSKEKNADLIAILQGIGTATEDGLSRLFTRSLGKEAELFGQHAERSGLSNSDILASNNTATSRFAGLFDFKDVVTQSFKGKLEFTEVGQKGATIANVTFSEEAPGEELLQVMEDAQKLQKERNLPESLVKFSKNAVRQLSRMHTFDLITLQTDRHWRNIKAQVTKKEGNPPEWIIDSVKCYDHDQSFGNKDLKEYFADVTDEATGEVKTKREGFLTPIMMTVSKSSNLYRYAKFTRMTNKKTGKSGVSTDSFLDTIQIPKAKTKQLEMATINYKKIWKGKDQYTSMPFTMIERSALYFNWGDPVTQKKLKKGMEEKNPGKEKIYEEFFIGLNQLTALMSDKNKKELTDGNLCKSKEEAEEKGKLAEKEYMDKHPWDPENEEAWEAGVKQAKAAFMTRKEALKLFRRVVELYNQLDLTRLEIGMEKYGHEMYSGGKDVVGFFDYNIQGFFHLLKLHFSTGEENQAALQELKADDLKEKEKETKEKLRKAGKEGKALEDAVKEEMKKEKAETVRMPAVLHMDREAVENVRKALNSEAQLDLLLKDLGMTSDKKTALKKRLQQILDEVKEATKAVNEWADLQGLPQDAIERKFLLDKEDWDKIDSLTDLALDPGMSYFSNEDSQFLMADKDMNKYLTQDDRERARSITNDERNTQRQRMGNLEGDYVPYVNNSIAKSEPAA